MLTRRNICKCWTPLKWELITLGLAYVIFDEKIDLDLDWSWDKLRLACQGKVGCEKHTRKHSSGFQSCQLQMIEDH